MRFKIGDYSIEKTFIIINKTSYPINGVAILRKHFAILDTEQGTNDIPKIKITKALTDEMQICNPEHSQSEQRANKQYQHKPPCHPRANSCEKRPHNNWEITTQLIAAPAGGLSK